MEGTTHGRDLGWQLDILYDLGLPLLDRAAHIHILDLLAEIGLRVDKSYQPVLDLQNNICALPDIFKHGPDRFDGERAAPVGKLANV